MPTLTFSVQPDGLLVEVVIGPDANQLRQWQAQGQAIPRPIRVGAIMDTGTDVTAVAPQVIKALGLPLSGSARTHTASGHVPVDVYGISLSILSPTGSGPMFTAPSLLAIELTHAAPGIDVLVGLDIILQGVLNVDGPRGVFSFTF
jgi:hypothetical protein